MARGIEAEIIKDESGFPTQVNLRRGSQKLTLDYINQNSFKIRGDESLLPILQNIYPIQPAAKLAINEPLQVQQVSGGKTVLIDDMESLLKWRQAGATVSLDNTFAYHGSQSLKLSNGALGGTAMAQRCFPMPASKKVKVSFKWSIDDFTKLEDFYIDVVHPQSPTNFIGRFSYQPSAWRLITVGGVVVPLVDSSYYGTEYAAKTTVGGSWHSLEAVFDFSNLAYSHFQVDHSVFNVSTNKLWNSGTGGDQREAYAYIYANAAAGQTVSLWIDDFLILEEK